MLSSYLKIAIRNLWRNRFYTFINLVGLSVGLTSAILITMFLIDELSYDKMFENYERTYRIESRFMVKGNEDLFALAPHPLGSTMKKEIPGIEEAVRVRQGSGLLYNYGDKKFYENSVFLVDSSYYKIFDFEFVSGDSESALKDPEKIIVSESFISKYMDPKIALGESILTESGASFEITGVYKDPADNIHFKPDAMVSYHSLAKFWGGTANFNSTQPIQFWRVSTYLYLLLEENADIEDVMGGFPAVYDKYMKPLEGMIGGTFEPIATRLDKVHHNETKYQGDFATSDINYSIYLGVVAVIILLLGSINYMNLATARSAGRSKEVAIRKVVGGTQKGLITQFILEAVVLTLLSLIISLASVEFLMDGFNSLANKNLEFAKIFNSEIILILIGIALFTGIFSGTYPAFYLSSFKPATILKGNIKNQVKSGLLRKILVITQFSLTIFIIIVTLHLDAQVEIFRNKPLGFDKENILLYQVRPNDTTFYRAYDAFKTELLKNPNIKGVASGSGGPGSISNKVLFKVESSKEGEFIERPLNFTSIDWDYIDIMDLKLEKGRKFDPEKPSDTLNTIMVNETFVRSFGWGNDALGKTIRTVQDPNNPQKVQQWKVIGVLKDFHFQDINTEIEPFMFFVSNQTLGEYRIKIADENTPETIAYIKEKVKEFGSDKPFKYTFVDETIAGYYKNEETIFEIFQIFSIITILISCLGLFGLVSFIAEQKTKEIGIRKVLGASVGNIVGGLTRSFIYLVLLSNLIAFPAAYLILNKFLEQFIYRTEIDFWLFIIAANFALIISVLTVSIKGILVARRNPVEALRYE